MASSALVQFLSDHPLTQKWLDDIIDVLAGEPRGKAHVSTIAKRLWADRDVGAMEQVITRRLNDFCSNAADFDGGPDRDLFERVAPATYRLRSWPTKPDTLNLIHIKFEDAALQKTWEFFVWAMKGKDAKKWTLATNEQRLSAFVQGMAPEGTLKRRYDELRSAQA